MEYIGVATGCGGKEVYRFQHTTYPYSSCMLFLQQHLYFLFILYYGLYKCAHDNYELHLHLLKCK